MVTVPCLMPVYRTELTLYEAANIDSSIPYGTHLNSVTLDIYFHCCTALRLANHSTSLVFTQSIHMSSHMSVHTQPTTPGNGSRPRAKIGVFCGSSSGANPAYIEAAQALGRALAEQDIDLGTHFVQIHTYSPQEKTNPLLRSRNF
jgi:hypothetical protein